MSAEITDWLVQEILELLDVSDVGLYEFIWLLNETYPDLDPEQKIDSAQQALDRVRESLPVQLVWHVWPEAEIVAGPTVARPAQEHWLDPTENPYLALSVA